MENLLIASLFILFGYLIGKYVKWSDLFEKHKTHINHMPPKYYGYDGTYWNTNTCSSCELVGMYEDLHPANPCPRCGNKVYQQQASKWSIKNNQYQWISKDDINEK